MKLKLSDFDYKIPKDLIALQPTASRDAARMLNIECSALKDSRVSELPNHLAPGDLIVLNNTKVIPARLIVPGRNVQIYLDKQLQDNKWLAFAKPGKKLKVNDEFDFGDLQLKVLEKNSDTKQILIEFKHKKNFLDLLNKYGDAPLPPYIEKLHKPTAQDKTLYQSIFAKHEGSVAAPTASLHFTEELLNNLRSKGVELAFITLHVGSGTFLPVSSENIEEHKMHEEYCELSQETAALINKTKQAGKKILTVGSTSMRVLEACAKEAGHVDSFKGAIDFFIKPGYKFKLVDLLLTNFHLPKTTLLMLVSAFGGYENIMRAYEHAIKNNYRLYSYGDCCLIKKNDDI